VSHKESACVDVFTHEYHTYSQTLLKISWYFSEVTDYEFWSLGHLIQSVKPFYVAGACKDTRRRSSGSRTHEANQISLLSPQSAHILTAGMCYTTGTLWRSYKWKEVL